MYKVQPIFPSKYPYPPVRTAGTTTLRLCFFKFCLQLSVSFLSNLCSGISCSFVMHVSPRTANILSSVLLWHKTSRGTNDPTDGAGRRSTSFKCSEWSWNDGIRVSLWSNAEIKWAQALRETAFYVAKCHANGVSLSFMFHFNSTKVSWFLFTWNWFVFSSKRPSWKEEFFEVKRCWYLRNFSRWSFYPLHSSVLWVKLTEMFLFFLFLVLSGPSVTLSPCWCGRPIESVKFC